MSVLRNPARPGAGAGILSTWRPNRLWKNDLAI